MYQWVPPIPLPRPPGRNETENAPMATKRAADLKRGDGVLIGKEYRVVQAVQFHDKPIDSDGTTGVRVWWVGLSHRSLIAADKELTVA